MTNAQARFYVCACFLCDWCVCVYVPSATAAVPFCNDEVSFCTFRPVQTHHNANHHHHHHHPLWPTSRAQSTARSGFTRVFGERKIRACSKTNMYYAARTRKESYAVDGYTHIFCQRLLCACGRACLVERKRVRSSDCA